MPIPNCIIADIKAICSFPEPEEKLIATSPEILSFNSLMIIGFISSIDFSGSITINFVFGLGLKFSLPKLFVIK